MLASGSLDRRIRLERSTDTQNPIDGSITEAWSLAYELWGQVEPLQGRELFEAQQWVAKADTRFTLRWPPSGAVVNPGEDVRLVYGGRVYDIKHVSEIGRRQGLAVLAQARAD